jgi:hypothetical protein
MGLLYGATARTDGDFPPNFLLMAVRVGKDEPGFYEMMTDLITWAEAEQVPVTVVDYEEGEQGFDIWMDTPETREIIGQILAFLEEELGAE